MARLNIEERCFAGPNIRKLAKAMRVSEPMALGWLALLWHDSQLLLKTHCSIDDIEVWCRCRDKKEAEKLVQAMINSGWLVPEEQDRYYIDGNRKQVDALISLREGAKAGGAATRKRWERAKSLEKEISEREVKPSLGPAEGIGPGQAQYNTIQCNTIQYNALKREIYGNSTEKDLETPSVEPNSSTPDDIQPSLIHHSGAVKKPVKENVAKTYPAEDHPLARLWNEHCGILPKVAKLNETRLRHARSRWSEEGNESYWIEVIKKISESKFCQGNNDRSWRASFDFLVQPTTHIKAMEGRYDNQVKSNRPMTHAELRSAANMELAEKIIKGEL